MKFGDKLILLRKKKGLSQEDLAEKLGVSRQSVSKWESNNTYPETDKIVQICNLFECSMDDLINDKITDIEQIERSNKNTLNDAWDSLLDFITKTINMFSHMKFLSGMKCIIEMFIVGFLLWLGGYIICNIASSILSHLFTFLNSHTIHMIREFLTSIFYCIWFVLSIIVIIHTFKIRYLNYYDSSIETEVEHHEEESKVEVKKSDKVIIRDEKDKPFAFLGILSKGIIYFIKFIVFCICIGIACSVIAFALLSFLAIFMIPNHIFFAGLSLSFVSSTIILSLLLLIGIFFIFSKEFSVKIYGLIFLVSLVFFGIGIGVSVVSLKNIEFIHDTNSKNFTEEKMTVDYQDDLVIHSYDQEKYNYQIDSSLEDGKIIILMNLDSKYEMINKHYSREDQMNVLNIYHEFNGNHKDLYLDFVNDLKKNQIFLHDNEVHPITIQANEKTIHQLIDNLKKLYLVEEKVTDQVITIQIHDSKVYFPNGSDVLYDARTDTLIKDEDVVCERSIQNTEWGERILYTCHDEDYDD